MTSLRSAKWVKWWVKLGQSGIAFADIERLLVALGAVVAEREGSRIRITLQGEIWRCHRPYPGKEAKRYQVEQARELLQRLRITP